MRSERVNPHFWTFSDNTYSPCYYFYYNFSSSKLDTSKHLEKSFTSKWIENPVYMYYKLCSLISIFQHFNIKWVYKLKNRFILGEFQESCYLLNCFFIIIFSSQKNRRIFGWYWDGDWELQAVPRNMTSKTSWRSSLMFEMTLIVNNYIQPLVFAFQKCYLAFIAFGINEDLRNFVKIDNFGLINLMN